jgi:quinol monooxygenase YgiN
MLGCCAVLDLRQYTLHPGQRDRLIEIFDESFVEGQEAQGMHIAGQFRDLDDPDRFVWLRGFTDLPARAEALQNFYYGPVWRARSAEANATMLDSDNALLLKPIDLGPGYPTLDAPRPPIGATESPDSVIAGAIYHRANRGAGAVDHDGFVEFFTDQVVPVLTDTGAVLTASFETLAAENNFPALPLRDDTVLAWFATFPDDAAYKAHLTRLEASPTWQNKVLPELICRSAAPPQRLRLRPTARSQFR